MEMRQDLYHRPDFQIRIVARQRNPYGQTYSANLDDHVGWPLFSQLSEQIGDHRRAKLPCAKCELREIEELLRRLRGIS